MSGARRLLLTGGIVLALWGMSYGLWYAVFAEHQALEEIGSSLARGFSGAAARNIALAEASLRQYQQAKYVYDRQVDVHGHWIGLAGWLNLRDRRDRFGGFCRSDWRRGLGKQRGGICLFRRQNSRGMAASTAQGPSNSRREYRDLHA